MLHISVWDEFWKRKTMEFQSGKMTFFPVDDEGLIAIIVKESINIKPDMLILEPGSGCGRLSLILVKQDAEVVLSDLSIGALRLARMIFNWAKVSQKAHLVLADLRFLPFRQGSFDIVFNEGVIERFSKYDRQKVINEIVGAAKLHGIVATFVLNAWNVLSTISKKRYDKLQAKRKRVTISTFSVPYSPRELQHNFRRAGVRMTLRGGAICLPTLDHLPLYPSRVMSPLFKRILGIWWFRVNAGYGILQKLFAKEIFLLGEKIVDVSCRKQVKLCPCN